MTASEHPELCYTLEGLTMLFASRKTRTLKELLCIKQYTFQTHKYGYTIIIYQLSRALYLFWDLLSHFVLPQYTH